MNKFLHAALLTAVTVVGLSSSGCATVTSSIPSSTAVTGEAWFTQMTGFYGFGWAPKVFYCPAPSSGPATCKEAKMVPLADK